MRTLRFVIEDLAFALLGAVAALLPPRGVVAVGAGLGRLGFALDRRRRRTTLANLRSAFGSSAPEPEIRRVARDCWRHFGRIAVEALAFPRLSAADAGTRVRYRGLEHVRAAYAKGKGVLVFSGHFGNWELVALMQGFLGLPLALVTKPIYNPRLERRLARLRSLSGNAVIHREGAVKEMLRRLKEGGGVAIVIDQDAKDGGIFVPFFGRPASTTPTLALLALKTGAAVVPVFSLPREDGGYDVVYEPEIPFSPTGDREADVSRLTEECTAVIERHVRERPELWSWMHRRWRTAPTAAAPGPRPPLEGAP